MNQPLPPDFVSQWDPNYQRYFYVNTATGKSQWEDPRIQPPPGPPPENKYGSPINQNSPPPYPTQSPQVNRQPSPQPYPNQPYNQPPPQPYSNQPSPQPYSNQPYPPQGPYRQPSPQPPPNQMPYNNQPYQQSAPQPKTGMNPMTAGLAGLAAGGVGGFLLGEMVENRHHHQHHHGFLDGGWGRNNVQEIIVENNGWGRNNVEEIIVENNGWGRNNVEEIIVENNGWGGDRVVEVFDNGNVVEEVVYDNDCRAHCSLSKYLIGWRNLPPVMNYPPPAQAPAQAPLPDGFIAQWNAQYQRNFFVNTKTGASQWEDPRTQFALPLNAPNLSSPQMAPSAPGGTDKGIFSQGNPPPYPGQPQQNYQYQPQSQPYGAPNQYPGQQYPQQYPQQQPQQQSTIANAMSNPMATGLAGAAAGLLGGVFLGEGLAHMENRHHHQQFPQVVQGYSQQPQVIEEVIYVNNNPGHHGHHHHHML
ncbi:hypothetical protein HDV01_000649 [Terramyces sp. JEL0728]|nr:hypothetical protein HDV01_000649 [Terramyces sp. JEL0728]